MKLILNKAVVGLFLATGAVAGTATTYSEINRATSQEILSVSDNEVGTPYLALETSGETREITQISAKSGTTIEVKSNTSLWTKDDVTLTIKATDTQSGVKQIELPDGKVVTIDINLFPGFTTNGWINANGAHINGQHLLSDYIEVDSLNFAFRRFKDDGTPINNYGEYAFYDKDKKFLGTRSAKQFWDENVKAPEGTKYIRIWSNPIEGSTGLGMLVYTTEKPSTMTKYGPYGSTTDIVSTNVNYNVNYTVSKNDDYTFKVTNKAGHVATKTIHVTNIDKTKPTVTVTGNPTEWTNQDVTLTITATDDLSGVQSITLPDGKVLMNGEKLFPGFTTTGWIYVDGQHLNGGTLLSDYIKVDSLNFAFRRFKDSGEPVNMFGQYAFYDEDKKFLGVRYDAQERRDENVTAPKGTKYIRIWSNPIEGKTGLGMLVYTKEKPSTITKYDPYSSINSPFKATYTVSENREYEFKVTDYAGNETTQTVDVSQLTFEVTGNPTKWTNQDVTLTIKASDDLNGVKRIELPDGIIVKGDTATYTVDENGEYEFKVTNNAGIETIRTVKVDKIDKTPPTIEVTGNPTNWITSALLKIKGSDDSSDIKQIELPNGQVIKDDIAYYRVIASGEYEFKTIDNAGNIATQTVKVTTVDNIKPTVTITGNPTEWTHQEATLTIKYSDNLSGIREVRLAGVSNRNMNIFTDFITKGYISETGEHVENDDTVLTDYIPIRKINHDDKMAFRQFTSEGIAEDKFGEFAFYDSNKKLISREIGNGDNPSPIPGDATFVRVWSTPTSQTENGLGMLVYTRQNVKPSTIVNYKEPYTDTLKVIENGKYEFMIIDNAYNVTTQTVEVTQLASIEVTGNPTAWTNQDVTLTIKGIDNKFEVKQIELPDGTVVTGDTATYTVKENGEYTFKSTNNAGIETIRTVKVDKIDKTKPTIEVTGIPTNWSNYVSLTIKGIDTQSGIKQIVSLNGDNWVSGGVGYYGIKANGEYKFKVTDWVGNESIETFNINTFDNKAPTFEVTGNPEEWTNQDTTLTIKYGETISGIKDVRLAGVFNSEINLFTGFITKGYISEKGEHVENDDTVLTDYISIRAWGNNKCLAYRQFTSEGVAEDKFGEFAFYDSNKKLISREIGNGDNPSPIPGNATFVRVWSTPTSQTENGLGMLVYTQKKPSTIVNYKEPYTDTSKVTKNGKYEFYIFNNVNLWTKKEIEVTKIDKTKPTVTVTGNPTEWTNQDATLTIKASDDLSGVKQITLPDGTIFKGDTAYYRVGENGDYEFKVTDKAGNVTTETVKVTKIERTKPTFEVTGNPTEWTNQDATLTIKASDDLSGVKQIKLPDGSIVMSETATYTVKENGNYKFSVTDNAGNIFEDYVNVTRISKTTPSLKLSFDEFAWNTHGISVFIILYSGPSGQHSITLPDGTIVKGMYASYKFTENGTYTFKGRDNAGNEVIEKITISNIDKTKPTFEVTGNPTEWTNQDVTLTVKASDLAGIRDIILNQTVKTDINLFTGFITKGYISEKGEHVENDSNVLSDYIPIRTSYLAFRQFTSEGVAEDKFGEFAFYDVKKNFISKTIGSGDEPAQVPRDATYVRVWSTPTSQTENGLGMLIQTSKNKKPSTMTEYEEPNTATFKVERNGNYLIRVIDNAQNESRQTVSVTKIDKEPPTINYKINKTSESSAILSVSYWDNDSGLQSIVRPNGETKVFSPVIRKIDEHETITQNSLILVSAIDKVGNRSSKNIDLLTIFTDANSSSGVSRIEYKLTGATVKDWTAYTAPFYVTNEGVTTITARIYDKAGNMTEKTSTVRIDKTKPTNNSILIEIK